MSHEATQLAQDHGVIDAEFTDIERVDHRTMAAIGGNSLMSANQLKEQIAHHRETMAVLKEYVESEMVENHDYYYMSRISNPDAPLKKGEKAALMQDGAFKFLNLFKYI